MAVRYTDLFSVASVTGDQNHAVLAPNVVVTPNAGVGLDSSDLGASLNELAADTQNLKPVTVQVLASSGQVVTHNLGRKPHVTFVDNTGAEIEVSVVHADDNQFTVTFNSLVSGEVTYS